MGGEDYILRFLSKDVLNRKFLRKASYGGFSGQITERYSKNPPPGGEPEKAIFLD